MFFTLLIHTSKFVSIRYYFVMNRVWIVEFEDNYASKNREKIRIEY